MRRAGDRWVPRRPARVRVGDRIGHVDELNRRHF